VAGFETVVKNNNLGGCEDCCKGELAIGRVYPVRGMVRLRGRGWTNVLCCILMDIFRAFDLITQQKLKL
jgi:hypothetical protein